MIGRLIRVELRSLRRSLVVPLTALFAVGGAIVGQFVAWADGFLLQAGVFDAAGASSGTAYATVEATLAVLGYVIAAAYLFGRDYYDEIIEELFTTPIPRERFLAAKMTVLGVWVVVLGGLAWGAAHATRLILSVTGVSADAPTLGAFLGSAVAAALLLPVVTWAAIRWRGALTATAIGLGLHVLAMGLTSLEVGDVLPWSLPLVLMRGAAPGAIALGLAVVIGVGGIAASVREWRGDVV